MSFLHVLVMPLNYTYLYCIDCKGKGGAAKGSRRAETICKYNRYHSFIWKQMQYVLSILSGCYVYIYSGAAILSEIIVALSVVQQAIDCLYHVTSVCVSCDHYVVSCDAYTEQHVILASSIYNLPKTKYCHIWVVIRRQKPAIECCTTYM